MAKSRPSVICPYCRANLNRGERCDCQQIDLNPKKITDADLVGISRAVLAAVKKYFEDPAVNEDYERWLVEYRKRPGVVIREGKQ